MSRKNIQKKDNFLKITMAEFCLAIIFIEDLIIVSDVVLDVSMSLIYFG